MRLRLLALAAAAMLAVACSESPLRPTAASDLPAISGLASSEGVSGVRHVNSCPTDIPTNLHVNTGDSAATFLWTAQDGVDTYDYAVETEKANDFVPHSHDNVVGAVDGAYLYASTHLTSKNGVGYRVRMRSRSCHTVTGPWTEWVRFNLGVDPTNDAPIIVPPVPPVPPTDPPTDPPVVCPEGQHVSEGVCVDDEVTPPPPVECGAGQHEENGVCVDDEVEPPPPPPPSITYWLYVGNGNNNARKSQCENPGGGQVGSWNADTNICTLTTPGGQQPAAPQNGNSWQQVTD